MCRCSQSTPRSIPLAPQRREIYGVIPLAMQSCNRKLSNDDYFSMCRRHNFENLICALTFNRPVSHSSALPLHIRLTSNDLEGGAHTRNFLDDCCFRAVSTK